MENLKKFIKERNVFLFVSFIISILALIVSIGEFTDYSKYVSEISLIDITSNNINTVFAYKMWSNEWQGFLILSALLLALISIFIIIGYIYKEDMFIAASIALSILLCFIVSWNIGVVVLLLIWIVLNILGIIKKEKRTD